jgi:hypothetical protein
MQAWALWPANSSEYTAAMQTGEKQDVTESRRQSTPGETIFTNLGYIAYKGKGAKLDECEKLIRRICEKLGIKVPETRALRRWLVRESLDRVARIERDKAVDGGPKSIVKGAIVAFGHDPDNHSFLVASASELVGVTDEQKFHYVRLDVLKINDKEWYKLCKKERYPKKLRQLRAGLWLGVRDNKDYSSKRAQTREEELLKELEKAINECLDNEKFRQSLIAAYEAYQKEQQAPTGGEPPPAYAFEPPPDHPKFVARTEELAELNAQLDDFRAKQSPKIVVISGMGGVGKTTLAAHWAKLTLSEGCFSEDRFVKFDFQGYSSGQTLGSDDASGPLLYDLGVSSSEIEVQAKLRAAQLRRHLAQSQRTTLVLLDNVASENDVWTLLPPRGLCFIIVTSRILLKRLETDRGAKRIEIDVLATEDAEDLLRNAINLQAGEEPKKLKEVAGHCGGLPLALQVAATQLADNEGTTLSDLARELKEPSNRVALLATGNSDFQVVFAASYHKLQPAGQRAFRLLGLRLNQDIDPYALTLLLGSTSLEVTKRIVRGFRYAALINRHGNRFGIHDLLHDYACELLDEYESLEERRAAFERLVDGYYGCVNYAFDQKNPKNPMVDSDFLNKWLAPISDQPGKAVVDECAEESDHKNAALWFEAERANLVDLVKRACEVNPPIPRAPWLAFSLFYFLEAGRHWADWQTVNEVGFDATRRLEKVSYTLDNTQAQAGLLRNKGRVFLVHVRDQLDMLRDSPAGLDIPTLLEQCEEAIGHFKASAALYKQCEPGSPSVRALTVQREFADVYLLQAKLNPTPGTLKLALQAFLEAWSLFEDHLKDEEDEVRRRNPVESINVSLSEVYRLLGDYVKADQDDTYYEKAKDCLESAHGFAGALKEGGSFVHPRTKGYAELRYAELEQARGNNQSAGEWFDQAIATLQGDNNPLQAARALAYKGQLQTEMNEFTEARASLEASLHILDELNSPEAGVVQTWLSQLPK